ncbi:hypothetical protein AB0I72_26860 [Nocardiopsis sp. NPDC049922]|uniref:hypothetical protein n=1 Tax=Nocardiopsis sp. NPDC049922 TaxID=3155157 RepID=UPI0033CE180F
MSYTPPAALPRHLLDRDDLREALARHDFATVVHLARQHGISNLKIADSCGMKPERVGKIARGQVRVTSYDKICDIADGLRIPGHLLGLTPRPWEQTTPPPDHQSDTASTILDEVNRRQLLRAAGTGLAAAPLASLTDMIGPPEPPDQVTPADIDHLHHAATTFATWDHSYGGTVVRAAVTSHLHWATALLDAPLPLTLRSDAFSAVAHLATVTGFMAFDDYHHHDARRMWALATDTAEEADDWHLRAKIYSHRARQAIWCAHPDQGLTYAEMGLVRSERLSAPEQAMLHTARARAWAKLGDVDQTLAAIDAADTAFITPTAITPPTWMAYYDHAQHHGDTGHALWDLAAAHLYPAHEAAGRLQTAVDGHGESYRRSRAISRIKLASLHLRIDPELGEATTVQALEEARRVRSRRAEDDLRELHRTCRHTHGSELADRVRLTIGSSR